MGFAVALAAGLLRDAYGRRALAVVVVIMVVPEVDSVLGPVMDGAHRTVGHNVVVPAAVGGLLYYDTRRRDRSWVRDRVGDHGVRIAWVGLFVHFFAHLFLDWAHLEGINLFWPLYDGFFRLDGELALSTTEGLVQTFVSIDFDPETGEPAVDAGATGTTDDVHVNNPVQPDLPERLEGVDTIDRRFPIAQAGHWLYLIGIGAFTVLARRFQTRRDT